MKIADISVYQGDIDWNTARKELEMVIFRSSIGYNTDKKYIYNAQNCNLPFGVYHYFKAGDVVEAKEEAEYFYYAATQEHLNPLFFCLDIEHENQNAENTKIICEIALETLKKLGAKKVGLYIGQSRYSYIRDIKNNFDFIWIPRYGKNLGEADEKYAPIFPCDIWQYTSVGKVSGISGNVDLNKLYGNKDLEWFIKRVEQPLKRNLFALIGHTVRLGDKSTAVNELQITLKKLGYDCIIREDKLFDNITEQALKNFQKENDLVADGICGPKTIQKLIG